MRLLPRSHRLAAEAAATAGVEPGERIIGWAAVEASDVVVVATDRGLRLPAPHGLVPWHRVVTASWDGEVLQVQTVDDRGAPMPAVRVRIDDAAELAAAVRDRVTDNVVVTERVTIVGDRGALLVARRQPGSDEIAWSVVFDAGLDHANPELRAIADERLAQLRGSLGI